MRHFLTRRPLVSVILPSFNHASYVAEAVESVLGQSLRDLELIVVDDASTDATPDIVAGLRDPRLTLIRLEANRAVHPRNLALSRARGRYVAFQNSDDVWRPGKLEQQVEAMEGRDRPSVCFTQTALVDAEGRPYSGKELPEDLLAHEEQPATAWLRRFFDIGNCLIISSAMVRRSDLVALGGFRASFVQLGDFDLWVRMAARGSFRILPEPLTLWRILPTNLSRPSTITHRRGQIELAQILERYAAPPLLDQLDRIFPEMAGLATPGARRVALALRALERPAGGFWLFADRAIAAVLDEPVARAEAVAHHGSGFIADFLARRGRSEFQHFPDTEMPAAWN